MSQGSLASDEDPIRTFGPPVADEVAATPYCKAQTLFDEAFICGRRYCFKSNFTRNISDKAIATLVERFATAPLPLSMANFQQLGNAANRVGATETAFSHRNALCEWGCDAAWLDPAEDAANIHWAGKMADAMLPFTTGSDYVDRIGLESRAMVNKPSVQNGLMGRRATNKATLLAGLIAVVSLVAVPHVSRADDNNGSGAINEKGVLNTLGANAVLSNGTLSQTTTYTFTTTTNTNTYTNSSHLQATVSRNQVYSNSNGGSDHAGTLENVSNAYVVINSGAVAMTNSMGGQGILQASQNTGANAVQQQAVTLNSAVGGSGGGLNGFTQPVAGLR
jgi:hypothetical protein